MMCRIAEAEVGGKKGSPGVLNDVTLFLTAPAATGQASDDHSHQLAHRYAPLSALKRMHGAGGLGFGQPFSSESVAKV